MRRLCEDRVFSFDPPHIRKLIEKGKDIEFKKKYGTVRLKDDKYIWVKYDEGSRLIANDPEDLFISMGDEMKNSTEGGVTKAVKCPVCEGSGKYKKKECHGCDGKGWVSIGMDLPPDNPLKKEESMRCPYNPTSIPCPYDPDGWFDAGDGTSFQGWCHAGPICLYPPGEPESRKLKYQPHPPRGYILFGKKED